MCSAWASAEHTVHRGVNGSRRFRLRVHHDAGALPSSGSRKHAVTDDVQRPHALDTQRKHSAAAWRQPQIFLTPGIPSSNMIMACEKRHSLPQRELLLMERGEKKTNSVTCHRTTTHTAPCAVSEPILHVYSAAWEKEEVC